MKTPSTISARRPLLRKAIPVAQRVIGENDDSNHAARDDRRGARSDPDRRVFGVAHPLLTRIQESGKRDRVSRPWTAIAAGDVGDYIYIVARRHCDHVTVIFASMAKNAGPPSWLSKAQMVRF